MHYSGNWNTKQQIELVENLLWKGLWIDLPCHNEGKTEGRWGRRKRRKQPLGNLFWTRDLSGNWNTKQHINLWKEFVLGGPYWHNTLKKRLKKDEDEEEDVCSYWTNFVQGIILEIKIINNRSASEWNSLWKRLGTDLSKLGQYNEYIYYCITQ